MKRLLVGALLAVVPLSGADARIVCNDGYQRVKGVEISTPYCEDEYLAAIARTYGSRVSGKDVRRSASLKYELCRFIGHDFRIRGYCPSGSDSSNGR